jgi:sulfatase maturation enzyme AslB (radical SAM superfamily)
VKDNWEDIITPLLNNLADLARFSQAAELSGAKNKEMIMLTSKENQKMNEILDAIKSALTTQKESFIKIIESKKSGIVEAQVKKALASQLKEVRSRIEALQQEFVGKMAIDALIKLSLELEAELSQLAEGEEENEK